MSQDLSIQDVYATLSPDQAMRLHAMLAAPAERPAEITVATAIERYLTEKRLKRAGGTGGIKGLVKATHYLHSFAEMFGNRAVSTCSNHDMAMWILEHPEWESNHTKTDAAGVVVTCFYWAAEQRLIPCSPFTRPRSLWTPPQPRVAITPDEYKAVMRSAKVRGYPRAHKAFRFALYFLWQTGARTCEMRELTWENIDFSTGIVTMTEHKTARSTGQARLIILTPALWRLLRWVHRRRKYPTTARVFLNAQKRQWTVGRFAAYFRKVAKFAGIRIKISPYCLRHGFTVRGLENGVGERQLADLLGHSTTRYVAWYGRATRAKGDYLRGVLEQVHKKTPPSP